MGAPHVHAAGDAASFEIKQGGLACLQADAAAETIAAMAGVAIEPTPFTPLLRAALVTEYDRRWLQRDLGDEHDDGAITHDAPWSPATKLPARELAPYLLRSGLPAGLDPSSVGVSVAGRLAHAGEYALGDLGVGVERRQLQVLLLAEVHRDQRVQSVQQFL